MQKKSSLRRNSVFQTRETESIASDELQVQGLVLAASALGIN